MIETTETETITQRSIHTLQCASPTCLSEIRVYRTTQERRFKYCPICGSQRITDASTDEAIDHLSSLARTYDIPTALMRQIYALWQPDVHHRFGDFITELLEEARGTADTTAAKTA